MPESLTLELEADTPQGSVSREQAVRFRDAGWQDAGWGKPCGSSSWKDVRAGCSYKIAT